MPLTPEQKRAYRQADKARGKKRITVTLTAEEYRLLELHAQSVGESQLTVHFRNVALHAMANKRHLSESELDILRDGLIQIRKIGGNINQLAHHANAGFSVNMEETKYQLRYLESLIQQYFGRS